MLIADNVNAHEGAALSNFGKETKMQDPSNANLQPLEWPKELLWIFDNLHATKFQLTETRTMDDGTKKTRPLHSPIPGLMGHITVSASDLQRLQSLASGLKSYSVPSRSLLVTFRLPPHVERTSFVDGVATSLVHLELVNHSA